MELRRIETAIPDWLWNPYDHWARFKGVGRIVIFVGLLLMLGAGDIGAVVVLAGAGVYGVGLLGLRMRIERQRERRGKGGCR